MSDPPSTGTFSTEPVLADPRLRLNPVLRAQHLERVQEAARRAEQQAAEQASRKTSEAERDAQARAAQDDARRNDVVARSANSRFHGRDGRYDGRVKSSFSQKSKAQKANRTTMKCKDCGLVLTLQQFSKSQRSVERPLCFKCATHAKAEDEARYRGTEGPNREDPRWEKARLAQALEEARKAKAVRRGIDPVKQPEAFSKVKLTMAEEADVEAGVQTKDVHAETSAMLADNWKDDDDDDY